MFHITNSRFSYSRYWNGTSFESRLMRGNIIKKRVMQFAFEKTPRISLSCKLVPVEYREYENGLLAGVNWHICSMHFINCNAMSRAFAFTLTVFPGCPELI